MRKLLIFAILITTPAFAAIHYVNNSGSPACSDSGTGTQAAPWCTFSYGVAHILGGDTLNVMTGTYTGDFTITGPSGTAGAHTIIQAGAGQTPVISGPGYNSGRMKISHGCSYIDFIGFTITNHNQGLYLDDDAGTSTACTNLLIDHITVHDVGQEGIAVRAGTPTGPRNFVISNSTIYNTGHLDPNQNGEGIYLGNSSGTDNTNGVTLLHNTIHDTTSECIELKGDSHDNIVDGNDLSNCITSSASFGNTGGAIEIDEPRNSVTDPHQIIRNNIIHDMPNAGGITKRGIRAGTGATIYNNVLYNIGNTYSCILSNSPNYPRLVYYNTVDCTTGNSVVNSGGTNLDNRDNIGPTGTANLAISSAYFTNYAGHDYHLVAASAPTTAGVNLTATVPNDITGTSRSSATTSIGAYLAVAAPVACTSAAINTAITSAPTGGTVTVNAGSCTWSSAVNISKAVKVVGATTCTGAGTTLACTDNTIITCSATPCLSITGTVGAIVDFSGFSLTTSGSAQVEVGKISISGDAVGAAFRLHHSHITASDCTSYMNTDEAYGLIDHVLFDIAGTCKMAVFGHWSDAGFSSWNASQAWGNSQALYIEDSRWNANNLVDGDIDGYAGGRLVVRHSYLVFTGASNGDSIGFHGLDSGGYRSFMTFESYNNTYTNNGSSQLQAGHLRGGTALFHDNTFNGSGVWNGVNIQILRNLGQSYSWTPCNGTQLKATPVGGPPSSSWGASAGGTYKFCAINRDVYCTADATCSAITGGDTCSTFLDGSGTNGYACRDQGGRTHNQVLSPVYAWNNGSDATCATGGSCTNGVQSVGGDDGGGGQLVSNRDFINGSAAPGYSPYTYPHPLQGGAPGTFTISGSLGANAANATVTWPESGGGTVSADGSGNYTIPNLANGTYTVTPQKTGFTFTPTNRSVTVSGADVSGVNFTAALAPIYSISGQVTFNAGSTDPDPVTISLTGTSTGSTTTDGSGNYTLSNLTNGTYTVTPSKATYTFAPANIAGIVILGANQTGKNFVATGSAAAVLTPATWDFGSEGIGIPSAGKVFQLSNATGTAQLTGISSTFTGANTGDFSKATTCAATLNAGATCTITVTFTPIAANGRSATLSVPTSIGTQSATLTGTGYLAPVPSCVPTGGSYKTARLITCSNQVSAATMCWKIGSQPATDGAGNCTVGAGTSLYPPAGILQTTSGTLYVTGTQAGNIDNTVNYAYTVSPSWTAGWVMQRNEAGSMHIGPRILFSFIAVTPNGIGTPVGTTQPFMATLNDSVGNAVLACVSSGWASSSPSVATIDASTGVATAVSAGTTTISCTDSGLTGSATLVVEIAPNFTNPSTPCTAPCVLSSGTVSTAYSNTLTASGGTAPYTYSVTVGSLPSGLSLTAGVISGTPSGTGTSVFTGRVCDSLSVCTSLQMSLTILASVGCTTNGPPNYTCASTSLADTTTPLTSPFTTAAPTPATCTGMCQNSTIEDTQLPGHVAGTYFYTRITDGVVLNGNSVSNLTQGGDNDRQFSYPNGDYIYIQTDFGLFVFHLGVVNKKIQVLNPGVPAVQIIGKTMATSWTTETGFYHFGINAFSTTLYQSHLNVDGSGNPTSYTDTALFNFMGAGNCPGITPFTVSWKGILGTSKNDDTFTIAMGPSGQEHADLTFAYSKTRGPAGGPGCAVTNWKTGQVWGFTACTPGTCTGAETPSQQFSSTGNVCWGSNGSAGNGIHDSQGSGDGNYTQVSHTGTWTIGSAACTSQRGGVVMAGLTDGTNQYCDRCDMHPSLGISKVLYGQFADGLSIRPMSDILSPTFFWPPPNVTDMHCSWAHNNLGTLDDNLPEICAGDSVGPGNGGIFTPHAFNNEVFAINPTLSLSQAGKRFGHTFACGATGYTLCPDNIPDQFGAGNALGMSGPKADRFCFVTSMLHSLGNDVGGTPRADAFCIYLGD